jgi:tRNA pseudouridine38-40 synthase
VPSILLTVAYDGAAFSGFAPQREGVRTVHATLLTALGRLDPAIARVRGVSRTDAGVHAHGQRVAFEPSRRIPPRGWVLGTNAHLPSDVAVRAAVEAPRGYEPRAHVQKKRYRYTVLVDAVRDPFLERCALRVEPPVDFGRLAAEAAAAIGTHDFAAFRSSADEREETVRTLHGIEIVRDFEGDPRRFAVEVTGNAFLHNMVRILVGTLLDVARGRLAPGAIGRGLASRDRRDLGVTAPAHGLALDEVFFAEAAWGVAWP